MLGDLAAWVEVERGRFILLLPVAMGAAILVYFALPTEPPLWLAPVLPGAAALALAAGWRWPLARFAAALALAAALGFARAEWRTAAAPPLLTVPYGAVPVTGRVTGIDLLPAGRRITLARAVLDGAPPAARLVRLRLRDEDTQPLNAGDIISVRAMLFRQDRPAYPGGWDFGRDAFFQRLGASGFSLTDVTVLTPARPGALAAALQNLRTRIAARILAVLPVDTGSVAVTLLTGFQQAMPPAERQNFVAAGLAHILAVAGLHVGIVMGLFFAATRFALAWSERISLRINSKAAAALVALAAGAGYAALTGAHLPILRSLAMASLVTLGVLAGRRAISLRGLALAASILLLATPEVIIGVSFQMSFSAVLALISGYAAAQPYFTALARRGAAPRLAGHVLALAFTSLLAGGASMPFAAYQFQQIQPYWILANLVAVPLTALWIMPLGLAALALMPFGLSAIALLPMGWGIAPIVWMTEKIAAWPGAMLRIPLVPPVAILLFTAGLLWLCLWRSRIRFAGLILMLAALPAYQAARPPDLLVSPDAKLIAAAQNGQVFLLRQKKASAYAVQQWAPVWGGKPFLAFGPDHPAPGAACDATGCRFTSPAGPVLVLFGPPPPDCAPAALAVSPEPLRGACDARGRVVIDRFTVWREGAIAAWITPRGILLRTDREVQGNRPWVPPWPDYFKEKPATTSR
jgi:competence protein ComEC